MAKLVFAMNQSLDGYVDHLGFAPGPTLLRHFIEQTRLLAGSVYGRCIYEVMRYWDDDHPEWDDDERAFAAAWCNQAKWVVSRSLKSVGPNAVLVDADLERVVRELKASRDGEIAVGGAAAWAEQAAMQLGGPAGGRARPGRDPHPPPRLRPELHRRATSAPACMPARCR
jgi:dihydrofolate reductase